MADEHDSWFEPFGFDPAQFAKDTYSKAEAAVTGVIDNARAAVDNAVNTVVETVTTAVPALAPDSAPAPNSAPNGKKGGGTVSTLGGSVGAGGANDPDDVKAVQRALGIADDGQCGGGTIAAIKAFQQSIGLANPDGRVDPGGRTAKALAGGGGGGGGADGGSAPDPDSASPAPEDDGILGGLKSLGGEILDGASDLGGSIVDGAKGLIDDAGNLGGMPVDGAEDDASGAATNSFLGGVGDKLAKKLKEAFGGASKTISFSFASFTLAKVPVGEYVMCEVKVEGAVEVEPEVVPDDAAAPSEEEVKKAVKLDVDALWAEVKANFKWEGVSSVGAKGDKKSVSVSATFFVASTRIGNVSFAFKGLELAFGSEGPKATVAGLEVGVPVYELQVGSIKYKVKILASGATEFSLNPAALALIGIEAGAAVVADIIIMATPIAFIVVAVVGSYFSITEAYDEAEIGAEAGEAMRNYVNSYMSVMSGGAGLGGPGGGDGKARGEGDLANLKVKYKDPETAVAQNYNKIWRAIVDEIKPKFKALAINEFKKKHETRVKYFGVPPSLEVVIDAYMHSYLTS
jgi:hypothetical protein